MKKIFLVTVLSLTSALLVFGAYSFLFESRRVATCKFYFRRTLNVDTVVTGKFQAEAVASAGLIRDSTTHHLSIHALVDSLYLDRVYIGMRGSCQLDGKEYPVTVTAIDHGMQDGRFPVQLIFSDTVLTHVTYTGLFRVSLYLTEPVEARLVRVGGFYKDSGGKYIYVVLPTRKAVKRTVLFGGKNAEYFQVLSGLNPGELVITSSYENFGSGDTLDLDDIRQSYD